MATTLNGNIEILTKNGSTDEAVFPITVPSAIRNLDGSSVFSDGKISGSYIADLSIGDTKIMQGTITGEKIQDRSLTLDKLSLDTISKLSATTDGAGAHNSVYRGISLGTVVTDEQYSAISSGNFTDLYIGDYWTIGGVDWMIGAFDYFYGMGDTACNTHHCLIVPRRSLYQARMNSTNTTSGGYVGSEMRTSTGGLKSARDTINSAFSGHVLTYRDYLCNAVGSNGMPSGGVWTDVTIELMSERMVYGNPVFSAVGRGDVPHLYNVTKSQLPLFAFNHTLTNGDRMWYWLRDVVSSPRFAFANDVGSAACGNASTTAGWVRPFFLLKGSNN